MNAVSLEILIDDDSGRCLSRLSLERFRISRARIVAAENGIVGSRRGIVNTGIVARIETVLTITHSISAIHGIRNVNGAAAVRAILVTQVNSSCVTAILPAGPEPNRFLVPCKPCTLIC